MTLFDHMADRLARGPAVLFPADPADGMAEVIRRYDPEAAVKSDGFVLGNGVALRGPVTVTPEVARLAGLPAGMTAGYYAAIVEGGTGRSRPDSLKWQDAERLIRGLAVRLGGTVHDERPPMDLKLRVSVYSGHELPAAQVVEVLQPYIGTGDVVVEQDTGVSGAYYLITKADPVFFVAYWPSRLSRSKLALPPPALGELGGKEPCRWDLRTKFQVTTVARETSLRVAEAALALAGHTGGVVIDTYGFPVDRPEDLLPR